MLSCVFIYQNLTPSSRVSIIATQNDCDSAALQDIDVVSLLLLAQKFAPVNWVEHGVVLISTVSFA